MKFKVVIEPGEDGYYVAWVPLLRGCVSQGKTVNEALKNIKESVELHISAPEK